VKTLVGILAEWLDASGITDGEMLAASILSAMAGAGGAAPGDASKRVKSLALPTLRLVVPVQVEIQ